MKKILLISLILIVALPIYAQDSTATGGNVLEGLPSWVYIAAGIVLGVYEVLVRLIPTIQNYSIIAMIVKVIKTLFPNNKQGGGTFSE